MSDISNKIQENQQNDDNDLPCKGCKNSRCSFCSYEIDRKNLNQYGICRNNTCSAYSQCSECLKKDYDEQQSNNDELPCGGCKSCYCSICSEEIDRNNLGQYGFCRCGTCSSCLREEYDDNQASKNEL